MRLSRSARSWSILALACLIALVFWPSTRIFYAKWIDTAATTYTHGWLILIVCIVLVIRARSALAAAPARVSRAAQLALACAVLAWLVCYRASIESLEVALVPPIFWLAVAAAYGFGAARALLFPAAYFYFAVPVWYGAPLQELTVQVMRGALGLFGPPARFSGDAIELAHGTFVIEEGCSGLHFMIAGLAVAALYGERREDPWRVRLRQLALMVGLALLANWVRVYTVIVAGYLTDMQSYLVRVSHYGFGWCVFAVALLLFFWVAPHLGGDAPQLPAATAVPAAAPAAAPQPRQGPRAQLGGLAGAAAILALLPASSAAVRALHPAPAAVPATAVIDPPPPWRAVRLDARSDWLPLFPYADRQQRWAFVDGAGHSIEVLSVGYRAQRQGAELVGEDSSLVGSALAARAERVVASAAGEFHETEADDGRGARSLIWARYEVAGRTLVRGFAQQLWYGVNALISNPSARLDALRTACAADCAGARERLREFVAAGGLRWRFPSDT